jgi:colanic acid biosynthesis glycosyl transferase WcaI
MRIVLHDFGGYPFTADLARALARRGHAVTYLYAAGFRQPRAAVEATAADTPALELRGIDVGAAYRRGAGFHRLAQERRYGQLLGTAIASLRPDTVISANCPLDAQAMALEATHRAGGSFVFWLQDLYSLAVARLLRRRLWVLGTAIGARYARLESDLLRRSDAVVSISPDFGDTLERWGVRSERIHAIENWAPLESSAPMPKDNPWARRHALIGQPTLLYAGTLGRKHDPTQLAFLASAIPEARMLVVAEGAGAEALRAARELPGNLTILPLQPAEELPAVLASADVLVAILELDSHSFSVPSKVLTYLAAGRPILAAIPAENLAARTILDARAGIVVEPHDRAGLAAGARHLLGNPAERERAGLAARAYAERAFDIQVKADEFERVLEAIAPPGHSTDAAKPDTAPMPHPRERS